LGRPDKLTEQSASYYSKVWPWASYTCCRCLFPNLIFRCWIPESPRSGYNGFHPRSAKP